MLTCIFCIFICRLFILPRSMTVIVSTWMHIGFCFPLEQDFGANRTALRCHQLTFSTQTERVSLALLETSVVKSHGKASQDLCCAKRTTSRGVQDMGWVPCLQIFRLLEILSMFSEFLYYIIWEISAWAKSVIIMLQLVAIARIFTVWETNMVEEIAHSKR